MRYILGVNRLSQISSHVDPRSWSGNANAQKTIGLAMKRDSRLVVTLPHQVKDQSVVEKALEN